MSRGPVRQIKALSSEDEWGTTSCQVPTWEEGAGGGGGGGEGAGGGGVAVLCPQPPHSTRL